MKAPSIAAMSHDELVALRRRIDVKLAHDPKAAKRQPLTPTEAERICDDVLGVLLVLSVASFTRWVCDCGCLNAPGEENCLACGSLPAPRFTAPKETAP